MYYKGTLRSTIHMSHRLRRKPPGLHSIGAGGPWVEIEIEEAHGELDSGDGVLPGGEGEVGEHEGHERDRKSTRLNSSHT